MQSCILHEDLLAKEKVLSTTSLDGFANTDCIGTLDIEELSQQALWTTLKRGRGTCSGAMFVLIAHLTIWTHFAPCMAYVWQSAGSFVYVW